MLLAYLILTQVPSLTKEVHISVRIE
jgi:hypothetical protein